MEQRPTADATPRTPIVAVEPPTSLREVLANDFPEKCTQLPIAGGWGRAKERPVVFVPSDGRWTKSRIDELEELVAKHIVYEELIVFRPFDDRFNGIIVEIAARHRHQEVRTLDRVNARVTCWREQHWRALESEVIKHDSGRSPMFDKAAFVAKREAWKVTYDREFWFDVTDVAP